MGFFKEQARRLGFDGARYLKPEDRLAVGVFFLLDDSPARRDAARGLALQCLRGGPVSVLGWRVVPVEPDVLPREARSCLPSIEQLLLRVVAGQDPDAVERWLYRARLVLRHRLAEAGLACYAVSLSCQLVNYKGMLTSPHLAAFYPYLDEPGFEAGLAIFHRRYSTNTYPDWTLAQPVPAVVPQRRDKHPPHQPQRGPRLRARPGAAPPRTRPALAPHERFGQLRRMAGASAPRQGPGACSAP